MLCSVVSIIFGIMVSYFVVSSSNLPDLCSTESVLLMNALNKIEVGADGMPRCPHLCPMNEYISRYASRLDLCLFEIVPVSQALKVKIDSEENVNAYVQ